VLAFRGEVFVNLKVTREANCFLGVPSKGAFKRSPHELAGRRLHCVVVLVERVLINVFLFVDFSNIITHAFPQ